MSSLHRLQKEISTEVGAPALIPTFTPTSSPELDALFSTFRSNVFLPSSLSPQHRKLIYGKKNHHLLVADDEPFTVRISDEVFELRPLDHLRDEPGMQRSFAQLLSYMKDRQDWSNLPQFLVGLKNSKRKLKDWQMEMMARKACKAGMEVILIECIRRCRSTGVGLWIPGVARELFWATMGTAREMKWERVGIDQALHRAGLLWRMMQDPTQVEFGKQEKHINPMLRPEIVGVMVQLHAAKALASKQKSDQEGKLPGYTQHLCVLIGKTEMALDEREAGDASYKLVMWLPVWHGLKIARQVLGETSKLGEDINTRLKEVNSFIEKAREIVVAKDAKGADIRGLKLYEDFASLSL